MSSTYGENLHLSIFGQSHGEAIGMTLDGVPSGLKVDLQKLQEFLNRRSPGNNEWSTARTEQDIPQFLSGLKDGYTCGAPIAAVIYNQNANSTEYPAKMDVPRPGHADYTAHIRHKGFEDFAGGGHFSGRLTAPLAVAGGLCKQWLENMGISINAHILSIGDISDKPFDPLSPEALNGSLPLPVLDPKAGEAMRKEILRVKELGDSIGGTIECAITGLPVGLGEPIFGGVESRISQIIYGIPAVKGLIFGDTAMLGSQNNDPFIYSDAGVYTSTNHCGGILGGLTNGMPVLFRVTLKPTPSIAQVQRSVNLLTKQAAHLSIKGRHDPCIVPRAIPVVEAAASIAIYDLLLSYNARR